MLNQNEMLHINKEGWNKVADQFFAGSFDTLGYGSYAPTEEQLNLLGDIKDRVVLEVGCGSGHTLEYLAKRGARELWGVDMSSKQIETAQEVVSPLNTPVTLIESPMEDIPGLPMNYFDIALSVYALGWTVDLPKTLHTIYNSLKSGGVFVFSWEHPIHSVVEYNNEQLQFRRSYVAEGSERHDSWRGTPIIMHNRKISTFINALITTGFIIDQVVEDSCVADDDSVSPAKWYSGTKARLIPSTLIIQCHKPR
ncbi:class I SAM-dependent methyltransferase [Paenibacillus mendelii]|uniref:Class I SAM-dependent methyltransferase n=1 Tax=Paenibacillus mendelii TaxID=206163 RepID=A0ABV6JAQ1_9BACL|nr:class I SAM-dependent methyltransferase [Paenibacillus mendelii]MCQ6561387.1 class I SAM-dependent methyltransferase [Paenibacillus mendelii]